VIDKNQKKEEAKKQRNLWPMSPVTRIVESRKKYNRQKDRKNKKLYDFYYHESFTACATICSIIVRNDQNEPDVIDKMRSYARENFRCVLFSGVKISMKLKMFLIAYCWWLYRPLLLWLKRKDLKNNR